MYNDFTPRRPLSQSQEELYSKLIGEVSNSRFRAVSFKMTDTLVLLPFSGIADICALMEKDFRELGAHVTVNDHDLVGRALLISGTDPGDEGHQHKNYCTNNENNLGLHNF